MANCPEDVLGDLLDCCVRNRNAWLSIAAFLAPANFHDLSDFLARAPLAGGKRSAASNGADAPASTLPHGNHGDNRIEATQ